MPGGTRGNVIEQWVGIMGFDTTPWPAPTVEEIRDHLEKLKSLYPALFEAASSQHYKQASSQTYAILRQTVDWIAYALAEAYSVRLYNPDKWYTISTRQSFRWAFRLGYISKDECRAWLRHCSNIYLFCMPRGKLGYDHESINYSFLPDFLEDAEKVCELIQSTKSRQAESPRK